MGVFDARGSGEWARIVPAWAEGGGVCLAVQPCSGCVWGPVDGFESGSACPLCSRPGTPAGRRGQCVTARRGSPSDSQSGTHELLAVG